MKKFLRKVLLFLGVGFVLGGGYAICFFVYEPINYLDLKKETVLTYDPVWKMKHFLKNPQPYIILGNSQVAHLNTDSLKYYSGKQFENIAFGGASLKESIDQFWWATECCYLKEVWIAVSFYTLNKYYNLDRVERLRQLVQSPFAYMTDSYYISLMCEYMIKTRDGGAEQVSNTIKSGEKYRDDLVYYAKEVIAKEGCGRYKYDERAVSELKKIGKYCSENNVKLVFIIPPMQESIFDLVIDPMGFASTVERVREDLSQIAIVYDFEFVNDFTRNQNNFQDGFHLVESEPSSVYLKALVEGKPKDFMKVYSDPVLQ